MTNAAGDAGNTNLVSTSGEASLENTEFLATQELYNCLYSSSPDREDAVHQVRVVHKGSRPQRVEVLVEGVPTLGLVDSGADITIIGMDLLRYVAMVAKLKKDRLKRVDKVPKTYDGRPFVLHGRMDMDISFNGITVLTPVYIKHLSSYFCQKESVNN